MKGGEKGILVLTRNCLFSHLRQPLTPPLTLLSSRRLEKTVYFPGSKQTYQKVKNFPMVLNTSITQDKTGNLKIPNLSIHTILSYITAQLHVNVLSAR